MEHVRRVLPPDEGHLLHPEGRRVVVRVARAGRVRRRVDRKLSIQQTKNHSSSVRSPLLSVLLAGMTSDQFKERAFVVKSMKHVVASNHEFSHIRDLVDISIKAAA